MKLSKGFVKEAFVIQKRENGETYDCFLQDYEYDNGHHETRFNIGINGWHEWHFLWYQSEEDFNKYYIVVE